jgi:hypothetical protein
MSGFSAHFPSRFDCPICGLRMVRTNAHEAGICPDHGEISGEEVVLGKKRTTLENLIEVRCNQARHEISLMAETAKDEALGCRRKLNAYWPI